MRYYLLLFVSSCIVYPTESTIGPGSRKSSEDIDEIPDATASSVLNVERPVIRRSIPQESQPPSEMNVLQRDLIQTDITPRTILENYESYCIPCADSRQFNNPTLIYITPWNNRGYDLIKNFIQKFDYVAPVWLRVKRVGYRKYHIDGTHDIDAKWIETLKEKRSDVRIVPRLAFERWTANDLHALFESEEEIQQLALTLKKFLIEYDQLFDGYVLEILSQFRGSSKATVNHILIDIAEHVHQIENTTRKKEIILDVPPLEEYFDRNDFETLSEHLDGFHIMTYDFPTKDPGPVSPMEWIKEIMIKFPVSKINTSVKVFLGINFYGYRYDFIAPSFHDKDKQQYDMKHIIGREYIEFLKQYYPSAKIHFDDRAHEHVTVVYARSEVNRNRKGSFQPTIVIFYPSLKSIYDRLELANKLHVGAAIWDGGQGFDYFFDLF